MRASTAGLVDASVTGEHDLALVAGPGREPRLEEVGRLLRLGPLQREPLRERRADARTDRAHKNEGDDPQHEYPAAVAIAPGGESLQHAGEDRPEK